MIRTVFCFGDSNTYGYDPRSCLGERYENNWCGKLSGVNAINGGMNGRRVPDSPEELELVLDQPADLLIVMLGTNDILEGLEPEWIAAKMEKLLQFALKKWEDMPVLLLAPPDARIPGAYEKLKELAALYERLAEKLGVFYADTQLWNLPMAYDRVHLSQEGHLMFAERLNAYLNNL